VVNYQDLDDSGAYKELLDLAERHLDSTEGKYWKIHGLYRLGHLEESLDYANTVKSCFNNDKLLGRVYTQLGKIYGGLGDIDNALDALQKGLDLNRELDDHILIAESMLNMGNMYRANGQLDIALETYENSLELLQDTEDNVKIAFALNNIGVILGDKGHFTKAEEYYQNSLTQIEKTGNISYISVVLQGLGNLYFLQGDLEKSKTYHLRSLELKEELGNNELLVPTLAEIMQINIEEGDMNTAKSYLNRIEELAERTSNKVIKLYWKYCKAIYLKNKKRNKYKVDAERIFEEIVATNDFRFEILIDTFYHLIELLVIEFKMYGEPVVLDEIENYVTTLYEIAQEHQIFPSIVDSLILRAKLSAAKNKVEKALAFIEQALITSEERGLTLHLARAEKEKENLITTMKELKKVIENKPIADMIDNMELLDYIQLIQKYRR